jgi:putative hemolysin
MRILILLPILAGLPALAHESTGNPASQFCVDLEGWLERGQNERGPTTNCVIEEWQLFRAMSKRNLVRP